MENHLHTNTTVQATGHVGPAIRPADKSDQPSLPLEAAQDAAQVETSACGEPPATVAGPDGKIKVAKKRKGG